MNNVIEDIVTPRLTPIQNWSGKMEKWKNEFKSGFLTGKMEKSNGQMTDSPISVEVEQGLDFILSHFQEPLWPRTIATKMSDDRQIPVYSRTEALELFRESDWIDCRISAYHYWRTCKVSEFANIKNAIIPDFIMGDLDKCNFKSERSLKITLASVLKNIQVKIAGHPSVIWSGNGYHIYQPIDVPIILENIAEFNDTEEPSKEFLRFGERYLTNNKSDKFHNNTVSLNNCMTRVPGSINSKNNEQVRIIKKWDGLRPNIKLMIGSFYAYIVDQRMKRESELRKIREYGFVDNDNPHTIEWVERLLQTPMEEHRKFAVWMILPQYLVNVRKISPEISHIEIDKWLQKCDRLRSLDNVGIKQKLKEGFVAAEKGFGPIGKEKIKIWKPELYNQLFDLN